jgi:hypothetical protein
MLGAVIIIQTAINALKPLLFPQAAVAYDSVIRHDKQLSR